MLSGPDTNNAVFHSPHPVVINLLKTFSTACFFRPLSTAACSNGPGGTQRGSRAGEGKRETVPVNFPYLLPFKNYNRERHLTQQHKAATLSQCADVKPLDSF